jgi:hypothetical protein
MRQPTRKPHFYKDGPAWVLRAGAWVFRAWTPRDAWADYEWATQWKKRYA